MKCAKCAKRLTKKNTAYWMTSIYLCVKCAPSKEKLDAIIDLLLKMAGK